MNYRRPLIQINCYELFSPFLEMECNVIWVKNCRILHVSRLHEIYMNYVDSFAHLRNFPYIGNIGN